MIIQFGRRKINELPQTTGFFVTNYMDFIA